jgi:hypothetical protein
MTTAAVIVKCLGIGAVFLSGILVTHPGYGWRYVVSLGLLMFGALLIL